MDESFRRLPYTRGTNPSLPGKREPRKDGNDTADLENVFDNLLDDHVTRRL